MVVEIDSPELSTTQFEHELRANHFALMLAANGCLVNHVSGHTLVLSDVKVGEQRQADIQSPVWCQYTFHLIDSTTKNPIDCDAIECEGAPAQCYAYAAAAFDRVVATLSPESS